MTNSPSKPNVISAFIPIIVLIFLLAINVSYFGDGATEGPNQIALVFAAVVASMVGLRLGYTWKNIQDAMVNSIQSAMSAILILLVIGALSGTWMLSGVVPTMIYYGLQILHPSYFLVAAVIICAIVSVSTGSSWSTIATVGVALLGIGSVMGMNEGMVAGAIISGAYFGDKMSPLSDTTNLAPAMAGADLFTHIRYMALTTVPSILLTIIIFAILGWTHQTSAPENESSSLLLALEQSFHISPILLLVPLVVFVLILKKVDALPALFIGTVLGAIAAIVAQPQLINTLGGNAAFIDNAYQVIIKTIASKNEIVTGNETMDKLLKTKGMGGMLNTIWLITCAMCFGGAMEVSGLLKCITQSIIGGIKRTGSLIAATTGTCIFLNATASDQYLAIVVPGRMFSKAYEEQGLAPENLSRTLEDSGTVTSVLFPWNTCGAAQSSVLQVATGSYWMYCFFNLISPLMTILFGYLNIKIKRLTNQS
jgi:Na+:H+ antiporter, NhaC family